MILLAGGCGYRYAGQATALPEAIRSIAIPVFQNDSTEPGIEAAVTRAVIEKFERDGRLRVTSRENADAALNGTIESYTLRPIAFDTNNNATEYRVKIRLRIRMEDKTGGSANRETTMEAQWDYTSNASITQTESAREAAIIKAAQYLGDSLVGYLLEGF
ncbi:MAG: LptE family protein [Nitrospinota bacterium]